MNIGGMLQYWKEKRSGELQMKHLVGKKVLDIGCGGGEAILDKENWVGIDMSKECVNACREKGIEAFQGSFVDITRGDFDGIICHQVLEHLTPFEAQRLFQVISERLNPGGIAYLSSPLHPVVWNTIDHTRPYPPSCIQKLLKQEKVYHHVDSVGDLEIVYFVYTSSNRLFGIIANLLPIFRDGYWMKLRRKKI